MNIRNIKIITLCSILLILSIATAEYGNFTVIPVNQTPLIFKSDLIQYGINGPAGLYLVNNGSYYFIPETWPGYKGMATFILDCFDHSRTFYVAWTRYADIPGNPNNYPIIDRVHFGSW
jgi:hypothetical protein